MSKPPYRVPSMAEIAAIPWNGLKVTSTFSGCGGSCLGYRMAGYRVVWANEFVPSAQDSYRANMAPGGVLDPRDVKTIQPEEILEATGLKKGELDLFDGSPPCQSFSIAGKRHKGWGTKKKYEGGEEQENETLFAHYVRLLRGLMPRAFVAENVVGLVKGTCKGMFLEILRDLKASGYRVSCRVLDAQWLGVPQQRQRAIFVGVREDLGVDPVYPLPLAWRYSVREAIPWIGETISHNRIEEVRDRSANRPAPTVRNGRPAHLGAVEPNVIRGKIKGVNRSTQWKDEVVYGGPDLPNPIIGATPSSRCGKDGGMKIEVEKSDGETERRKFTIAELRRICAFPDDFVLMGSYARQWERLGNSVPPIMMFWVARTIRDAVLRNGKKKWVGDPPCLVAGTGK